jgi:hypothetical protein
MGGYTGRRRGLVGAPGPRLRDALARLA